MAIHVTVADASERMCRDRGSDTLDVVLRDSFLSWKSEGRHRVRVTAIKS